MSYIVREADPKIKFTVFVCEDYAINMRDNLSGISYTDAEQLARINAILQKYRDTVKPLSE